MTRKEAIEKLELMRQKVDEETYRALILAIKALEQEPTFDDECQKDMDEAWEQIQKKRKRIPVTLGLTPCDNCKHNNEEWDSESCDGCCGNNSKYEPCDDAISREALVDDFIEWREKLEYTVGEDYSGVHLLNVAIQKIWGMPSVTQKSKTGHWIEKHKIIDYVSESTVRNVQNVEQ